MPPAAKRSLNARKERGDNVPVAKPVSKPGMCEHNREKR